MGTNHPPHESQRYEGAMTVTDCTTIPHTFIYALCDPETGEIRYVGKSNNPAERHTRHHAPQELNADTHKARWLRTLVAKNLTAKMIVLECVPLSDWQAFEIQWIATLRSEGHPLTNSTIGGEGVEGLNHTAETRSRISNALRNRIRSKESYDKASAKLSGRIVSQEERKKFSEARKRYWDNLTEEEKQRHIASMPRQWTEESRAKLADSQRGLKKIVRTSHFVGVCWFKRDECWRATIKVGDKQVHLGYFDAEADAAVAYNHGALQHFGNIARFNDVPDWQSIKPKRRGV